VQFVRALTQVAVERERFRQMQGLGLLRTYVVEIELREAADTVAAAALGRVQGPV